jgi:MoxR-like ATPase
MQRLVTTSTVKKDAESSLERVVDAVKEIILGKEEIIRLALTCIVARGHLLIEDLPGVGKTTLAHVLAKVLGLQFQRVQFTSDMLPADILGVSVYDQDGAGFRFHPGPIFAQLILADEVNRATPKAQSALLEAMEEYQVTTEGETYALPEPFFVIATQNPATQVGTFPLPESQLDRFLMRLEIGYPDQQAERALLKGRDRREMLKDLSPCLTPEELIAIQAQAANIHVSTALVDYLQSILEFSRQSPLYRNGLSPRAGLGLLRSAQAWALLNGRTHVLPEDVQHVMPCVVNHRLRAAAEHGLHTTGDLAEHLLTVPVP